MVRYGYGAAKALVVYFGILADGVNAESLIAGFEAKAGPEAAFVLQDAFTGGAGAKYIALAALGAPPRHECIALPAL